MSSPVFRLMRLHQPTGIWLLMWPCWWAVVLASGGAPSPVILCLFLAGAVLMRSAGCIINDLTDRKLDREVERTRSRPLASGELSVAQGIALLVLLLAAALPVALLLGKAVLMWGVLALPAVAIYPWMKRISWWPQLFLGLTFNWGALMGWAAVRGEVELPALLLYVGGMFWTLGYDTIYGHQDKIDDARIGIKSSSRRLGNTTKPIVTVFYILALCFWGAALAAVKPHIMGYGLLGVALMQLLWQVKTVELDNPASCRRVFKANAGLGALVTVVFLGS